jgi:hypothetical protein
MSEAKHLSSAISGLFSDPANDWFMPFVVATDDLSAAQATWVPGPGMNSIWQIVNHIAFWHEVVLLSLRNLPVSYEELGSAEGWPPYGAPDGMQTWEESRHNAILLNEDLAALVASFTAKDLAEPIREDHGTTRWQVLHGLIGHTSYHTGEISFIRGLQASWPENLPD